MIVKSRFHGAKCVLEVWEVWEAIDDELFSAADSPVHGDE